MNITAQLSQFPAFLGFVLAGLIVWSCSDKVPSGEKPTVTHTKVEQDAAASQEVSQKIAVFENPQNPRNYMVHFAAPSTGANEPFSLDTREKNPFRDLPYPLRYMSEDSVDYAYDLGELSRSEQHKVYAGMHMNEEAHHEKGYLRMYVKTPVVALAKNRVAVAYYRSFYTNDEDILGSQGAVLIFDEYGNEVRRIEDRAHGFYDIRLSDDGRFLMQKYGTNYGEDGSGQLHRGFKFYDTSNGEMVAHIQLGQDQFITGYGFYPKHNQFAVIDRIENGRYDFFITDIPNAKMYVLTGDANEYIKNPTYLNTYLDAFRVSGNVNDLIRNGFSSINTAEFSASRPSLLNLTH